MQHQPVVVGKLSMCSFQQLVYMREGRVGVLAYTEGGILLLLVWVEDVEV